MAVFAGRSLKGFDLLQVPFGHDLGEEAVGFADPGFPRLDPGLRAVGLRVDGRHAGMLAEFGRPYTFETEQVKLDAGPAEFPVEGFDDLQNALRPMKVPPAHGADANDRKSREMGIRSRQRT